MSATPYLDEDGNYWVKTSEAPTREEAEGVVEDVRMGGDEYVLEYHGVVSVSLWEGEIGEGASALHEAHHFEEVEAAAEPEDGGATE